jgi:hypothetical protein
VRCLGASGLELQLHTSCQLWRVEETQVFQHSVVLQACKVKPIAMITLDFFNASA